MNNKFVVLAKKLTEAKLGEAAAKAVRESVEGRIYTLFQTTFTSKDKALPERGKVADGPLNMTIGVTEKWDQDKLAALEPTIPPEFWPFDKIYRCDASARGKLAVDHPEWYRKIFTALSTKPKKPAFAIDVKVLESYAPDQTDAVAEAVQA